MIPLQTGFTDIHTHLFPVQDGPKNMEQAIRAVRIAAKNNITNMILTPHFNSCDRSYDQQGIMTAYQALRKEIILNKIWMNVHIGNEISVDENTVECVRTGRAMTLGDSDYVLCEYPLYQVPFYYQNILYDLLEKGYHPVIAHPERNSDIDMNYKSLVALRDNGCLIQINAGSILGKYGSKAKKYVIMLLKEKAVDFVASDAHSDKHRSPVVLMRAFQRLGKWLDNGYLMDVFIHNPKIIISNNPERMQAGIVKTPIVHKHPCIKAYF